MYRIYNMAQEASIRRSHGAARTARLGEPHPPSQDPVVSRLACQIALATCSNDERDKDVGGRNVCAIEERVDPLVVYAPWRQLDRVEVLHAPLAEVRCDVAGERHDQHARVQRQVSRVRADTLPCRHAVRQRRRSMPPAPPHAERRSRCRGSDRRTCAGSRTSRAPAFRAGSHRRTSRKVSARE